MPWYGGLSAASTGIAGRVGTGVRVGHGVGVITGTGVQVGRTLVAVALGTGVDVATAVGSGSAVAVGRDVGSGIAVVVGKGVGAGAALEQASTMVPISNARTTVSFIPVPQGYIQIFYLT